MQLDCPKCKTSFSVDLIHIGESRQVECSVCSNKWIAKSSDLVKIETEESKKATEAGRIPDSSFGKAKYFLLFIVFLVGLIGLMFLEKDLLINSHTIWIQFFKILNL